MKTKKVIYVILLCISISFIAFVYNSFNGNPITKFAGKIVVKKYLKETYPSEEFRVDSGSYSFKFGEYSYPVFIIGSGANIEYPYVNVRGTFMPKVSFDGIHISKLDTTLNESLSIDASSEIYDFLLNEINIIKAVEVSTNVLKGDLPSDATWSKDLNIPISLHIIIDSSNENEDEFIDTCKKIQDALNSYNYSKVNVNGNVLGKDLGSKDKYGYVKFAISFNKTDDISRKKISKF